MKTKLFSLLLLCMLAIPALRAQTFYQPQGFTLDPAMGHATASTGDGGAILTGYDTGYQAMFVVKTDASDNVMWDFTYRMAGQQMVPHDIIPVGGEGYLISGRSLTHPFAAVRLMISTSGAVLWSRRTAGNRRGIYFKSIYDFNNERILSVGAIANGSNPYTFLFSSIRPDGTGAVDQVIPVENNAVVVAARDIARASDGGYLIVGSRFITNDPFDRVYAVKLAPGSYTVQWARRYDDADGTFSLQATTASSYYDIFGGGSGFIIGGKNDIDPSPLLPGEGFMYQIDDMGGVNWSRLYHRPIEDLFYYWYGGIHATGTDNGHPFVSQHLVNSGITSNYREYGHQFNSSTNSDMQFTELQLRFLPGSWWPSGMRAGGYYTVGTDRLVSTIVGFGTLENACASEGGNPLEEALTLNVTTPAVDQNTLGLPIALNFYQINRNVTAQNCGNLTVNISGLTEECFQYIGMFPITLSATSSHSDVSFSWQIPPGFSGNAWGANNQFLDITGAPTPPTGGSTTDFFWVTANYALGTLTATDNHAFTVNDCDDGWELKRADDAADPGKGLELFPNPASAQVALRLPAAELPATVRLLSLDGKVMKTLRMESPLQSIALDDIAKGLYFVEAAGKQRRHTQKLVVR